MEALITSFLKLMPRSNLPFIVSIPPPRLPPPSLPLPPSSKTSSQSLSIINALEDMINKFIDPPTRSSSVDPTVVLSNNFAPVDELPPTECHLIEGSLPTCLNGAYLRNGPNPQFFPRGPYHLFDGDGMIHCLVISNGKATLSSRFVKTHKFLVEREAGGSLLPNIFAGANGLIGFLARATLVAARVMSGELNLTDSIGVANTSVAFLGNRLFALCESDLPYELSLTRDGDIQTLGRVNFNGDDLLIRMTAHPKFDHETKQGFAFLYDVFPPFLTYFWFGSKGAKHKRVPIFSKQKPSYLHDFFITMKYAIFPDIQIIMDPLKMILRGESFLRFDPKKVSRVGIMPRYSVDEKDLRWFEVPNFNMLHGINAWDEMDEDGNETINIVATNPVFPQNAFDQMEHLVVHVEKIRIDLKIGLVSRQTLSTKNLDLPVINSTYVGKKNKYAYAAIGEPLPKITGVVKLDVSVPLVAQGQQQDCAVASRMFGPGCYGGEPFFVANETVDSNAEEDDGYLVTYVHDENAGESRFLVMDAKTPGLDVVASIKLPQRVPYGFHGLFVKDKDLKVLWDKSDSFSCDYN